MAKEHIWTELSTPRGDVKVVTKNIGPERYRIVATATFDSAPADVWALMWDWEHLLAVGLPGLTSDFRWLSGGPEEVPSTFQFQMAGATIKEEIYERMENMESSTS